MIPDFLKKKEVQKDMFALQESDLMQQAFRKQDADNETLPSMSEMFAKKRKEAEDALANKHPAKPNEDQIADRKAKLLA